MNSQTAYAQEDIDFFLRAPLSSSAYGQERHLRYELGQCAHTFPINVSFYDGIEMNQHGDRQEGGYLRFETGDRVLVYVQARELTHDQ
jgi:hypothetical protein